MKPEILKPALRKLKANRGDVDAWEDLYRLLWPWLLGTALRELRTSNVADAQDLSQDVFLALIERADFDLVLNQPGIFLGYVRRICRNRAIDRLRSAEARTASDTPLEDLPAPAAVDSALRLDLERAVERLTPEEAKLLYLLRAGMSNAEIANELKRKPGTVYNMVSDLRHLLLRLMGRTRG